MTWCGPLVVTMASLLPVLGAVLTVVWCASMASMGMAMPGGWTMSMAWMRMPGQSWPGAAVAFVGMWTLMMLPMMLPALVPMLVRYRAALRGPSTPASAGLMVVAAAGYYASWSVVGLGTYVLGAAVAGLAMAHDDVSRAVPMLCAVATVLAGLAQWTTWKARALGCCDMPPTSPVPGLSAAAAWRDGLRLGVVCARCCANLMVLLPVLGVMDLTVMVVVTVAIGAERLWSRGVTMARVTGTLAVGWGVLSLVRS